MFINHINPIYVPKYWYLFNGDHVRGVKSITDDHYKKGLREMKT